MQHIVKGTVLEQQNDQVWVSPDEFISSIFENNVQRSLTNGSDDLSDYKKANFKFTEGEDGENPTIKFKGNEEEVVGTYELTGRALFTDGSTPLDDAKLTVVVFKSDLDNPYDGHYTLAVLYKDGDAFDQDSDLAQFDVHKVKEIDGPFPGRCDPPICFTAGTKVLTVESGYKNVEDLAVGEMINTLAGAQAVKWIGSRQFSGDSLSQHPEQIPTMIKKGALGQGLPMSDTTFSRQHRVAVSRPDGTTSLIAAGKLENRVKDIEPANHYKETGVDYIHVGLAQHAIMLTESGIGAESLLVGGEYTNEFMSASQRAEIESAYGKNHAMEPAAPIEQKFKKFQKRVQKDGPMIKQGLAKSCKLRM